MLEDFNAEEYFSNLPVMTYKKIIDYLKDQTRQKIIIFSKYVDAKTGKTYQEVRVRFFDPEEYEYYISPDQNVDDIEKNLYRVFDRFGLDVDYAYQYDYVASYIASYGKNYLDFPREIANRIVKEAREAKAKSQQSDGQARVRTPEVTYEDTDSEGELPFEI